MPNSSIRKRSVTIGGHQTSVALEDEFWDALRDIARKKNISLNGLITKIDGDREEANLSSAIRLHILRYFRCQRS